MRKEATLKEWKRLYDLGLKFIEARPWEMLDNLEYVCIRFAPEDEAYFTIMGNGGMEYGFGMYIGEFAFREMNLNISSSDYDNGRSGYGLYLQNCITMFMDPETEIPEEQMDIIRKLGLDFGKGRNWVYFENHARGYAPYIPDQADVKQTIRFLEQLVKAIPLIGQMKPRGLHIPDQGFIFEKDGPEWKLGLLTFNTAEMCRLPIALISDEKELKDTVSKWKKLDSSWELDIVFMRSLIDDEKYDRPLAPHMLLIMDHETGAPVYQDLLEPECGSAQLCQQISAVMAEYGRPKEIIVPGPVMKEILSVLDTSGQVPVRIAKLRHLDRFASEMLEKMNSASPMLDMINMMGLDEEEVNSMLEMMGASSVD